MIKSKIGLLQLGLFDKAKTLLDLNIALVFLVLSVDSDQPVLTFGWFSISYLVGKFALVTFMSYLAGWLPAIVSILCGV